MNKQIDVKEISNKQADLFGLWSKKHLIDSLIIELSTINSNDKNLEECIDSLIQSEKHLSKFIDVSFGFYNIKKLK